MTSGEDMRSLVPFPDRLPAKTAVAGRILSTMVEETLALLHDAALEESHLDALVREAKQIWDGKGMTPENIRAFELLYRAGNAGHGEAQFLLYKIYRSGSGVSKDRPKAIEWVKKAADSGVLMAYVAIGVFFFHGKYETFPQNDDQALLWLKKAVDSDGSLGRSGVCSVLCQIYERRNDFAEALKWHKKGVESGEPDFIYSGYKLCTEKGTGETDMPEAYVWCQLAAVETQLVDARESVNQLTQKMSPEELVKASRLFTDAHSKYRANL